ncbi:MAG: hypothetical protein RR904_05480 [Bacilli bacterium]
MQNNYFTFPMETLNISQSYNEGNHLPHTTGTPKDYPIDICGIDSGQSAVFCPCDEMIVTAVYNPNNKNYANTLYLESTTSCITPSGKDIVFMTLTHINDIEMARFHKGQIFKRGSIICYEGTSGNATGNHIHLCVGFGTCTNMTQNNFGKWVMKGDNRLPQEMMYVDRDFTTTIKDSKALNWRDIPQEETVVQDDHNKCNALISTLKAEIAQLNAEKEDLLLKAEKEAEATFTKEIKKDGLYAINLHEGEILKIK